MREQEPWASVLELEPTPHRCVQESSLDDFAYAVADIVDLKSKAPVVHCRRTAEVAERIAKRLNLSEQDVQLVRRGALVHDVGLVAVPSLLLKEGTTWSEGDAERFRLHT